MWAVAFSAQYTSRGHREEGKLVVKYEENLDGKRKEKTQEREEKAQKTEESLFGKLGLADSYIITNVRFPKSRIPFVFGIVRRTNLL